MSEVLSFSVLDGQHVELLPPRIVLSLFSASATGGGRGGNGGHTGPGGAGKGGLGLNLINANLFGEQHNNAGDGVGGDGGIAGGGAGGMNQS
jgi:hypothetical protein